MNEHDLDELSLWQDILDQLYAGRTTGHKCPYCKDGNLDCEADEFHIFAKCLSCGKYFEGRLG